MRFGHGWCSAQRAAPPSPPRCGARPNGGREKGTQRHRRLSRTTCRAGRLARPIPPGKKATAVKTKTSCLTFSNCPARPGPWPAERRNRSRFNAAQATIPWKRTDPGNRFRVDGGDESLRATGRARPHAHSMRRPRRGGTSSFLAQDSFTRNLSGRHGLETNILVATPSRQRTFCSRRGTVALLGLLAHGNRYGPAVVERLSVCPRVSRPDLCARAVLGPPDRL